jgi:hypothetical protein
MKEKVTMIFMVPVIKSLLAICGLDKELKAAKKEIKRLNKSEDDSIRLMRYEQGRTNAMNLYATKLLADNEELVKAINCLHGTKES